MVVPISFLPPTSSSFYFSLFFFLPLASYSPSPPFLSFLTLSSFLSLLTLSLSSELPSSISYTSLECLLSLHLAISFSEKNKKYTDSGELLMIIYRTP